MRFMCDGSMLIPQTPCAMSEWLKQGSTCRQVGGRKHSHDHSSNAKHQRHAFSHQLQCLTNARQLSQIPGIETPLRHQHAAHCDCTSQQPGKAIKPCRLVTSTKVCMPCALLKMADI